MNLLKRKKKVLSNGGAEKELKVIKIKKMMNTTEQESVFLSDMLLLI